MGYVLLMVIQVGGVTNIAQTTTPVPLSVCNHYGNKLVHELKGPGGYAHFECLRVDET